MLEIFLSQYPLQQILDGINHAKIDDYVLLKKTDKKSILSTLHKNYIINEDEKKILSEYFIAAVTITEPGCLPTRKEHPAILSLYQPYNLERYNSSISIDFAWLYSRHLIWIINILSIKGSVSNRQLKYILASKALFVLRKHKILANIMDEFIVKNQTKINDFKLKEVEKLAIKDAARQAASQRKRDANIKARALKNELNEKIGLNKELERIRKLKRSVNMAIKESKLADEQERKQAKAAAKLAQKEAAKEAKAAAKLAKKEAVKEAKAAAKLAAKSVKA
jgi:hypothetical protein